MGPVHPGSP